MEGAFEFEDHAVGDFYWKEGSDFYPFGLCVCFDGDLFHIIGIAIKVAVGTDFVYHHCSDSPYFLLVIFGGDLVKELVEAGSSLVFDGIRDIIGVFSIGEGAGAVGIDSHINHIKASVFGQF